MAEFTDQEISDILESFELDEGYAGWSEWQNHYGDPVLVPELGYVSLAKNEREDSAYVADVMLVLKIQFYDGTVQHYRVDGTYRSYDGSTWDTDAYPVEYKSKAVMDWLPVDANA